MYCFETNITKIHIVQIAVKNSITGMIIYIPVMVFFFYLYTNFLVCFRFGLCFLLQQCILRVQTGPFLLLQLPEL